MTRYLNVDSHSYEIRWHLAGTSDSFPVLVFLHEGLGCVDLWKSFPDALCRKTRCPGFVFSRPGYGRSGPSPLPWKINFMHTQALRALPKLLSVAGIRDHILIGHSDGGSIAIIYAGSRHATELRGLITESAHVFCEDITLSSIRDAREKYLKGNLKLGLSRYHGANTDTAFYGWNQVWLHPRFVHFNICRYLPRIRVPLLAMQGAEDPYGTPAQLEAIAAGSPGCETALIAGCRHAPHQEQPEIVLERMAGFIETCRKGR